MVFRWCSVAGSPVESKDDAIETTNFLRVLKSASEVLTLFFCWDAERENVMFNSIAVSTDHSACLELTWELINSYLHDNQLVPRSTYRKAIGEGIRTITYGAHTSLAAHKRSNKFVTNITTAEKHELSGPISRDIAILSLRYPISRDTF